MESRVRLALLLVVLADFRNALDEAGLTYFRIVMSALFGARVSAASDLLGGSRACDFGQLRYLRRRVRRVVVEFGVRIKLGLRDQKTGEKFSVNSMASRDECFDLVKARTVGIRCDVDDHACRSMNRGRP